MDARWGELAAEVFGQDPIFLGVYMYAGPVDLHVRIHTHGGVGGDKASLGLEAFKEFSDKAVERRIIDPTLNVLSIVEISDEAPASDDYWQTVWTRGHVSPKPSIVEILSAIPGVVRVEYGNDSHYHAVIRLDRDEEAVVKDLEEYIAPVRAHYPQNNWIVSWHREDKFPPWTPLPSCEAAVGRIVQAVEPHPEVKMAFYAPMTSMTYIVAHEDFDFTKLKLPLGSLVALTKVRPNLPPKTAKCVFNDVTRQLVKAARTADVAAKEHLDMTCRWCGMKIGLAADCAACDAMQNPVASIKTRNDRIPRVDLYVNPDASLYLEVVHADPDRRGAAGPRSRVQRYTVPSSMAELFDSHVFGRRKK